MKVIKAGMDSKQVIARFEAERQALSMMNHPNIAKVLEAGMTKDGRKIYTLEDIYPFADLVTYPSTFEGFGNAFLEAVYFKKPVVVNAYSIYTKDIKPKGFSVIEIDGYVTRAAVEKTKVVLENQEFRQQMVDHNYELGLEHFSYGVLHRGLKALLVQQGWIKLDLV